ncbi:FKBP-type peptidyl-prolyl cis-trans isomerase [Ilumatobacter sp.]|uniref:FKBP-type peptidyl-prolyl cis-trans isomerase n=1 Tax=Ilumatobacter sp. TaxID=1967498 RepID=UPI003B52FFF4
MRRTVVLPLLVALVISACGSSDSDAQPATSDGGTPPTEPIDSTDAAAPTEGTTGSTSDDEAASAASTPSDGTAAADDTTAGTVAAEPAAECVPDGETLPEPDAGDAGPPPTGPDKPQVETPEEPPTELVRTVLEEGEGDEAVDGDTVVVDYVGVRSDDGLEFDNSYDRDEPFPVTLGRGSVIQGWEQGLVGSQPGERIQLDIPAPLAYGETARPPVICEDEDLTFVIDVRAVVKAVQPGDVPTEPGVELSTGEGVDTTTVEDLAVGEGEDLELGDTAIIRYVNFRGDNGVAIETGWDGDPIQIPFEEDGTLIPGLLEGMSGMKVGGRRAITIPPEEGFGPQGNPQGGLPADTDMIFVIELVGVY